MIHVSSNTTLFFKFFLPVFWAVFFGAFFIGLFFIEEEYIGNIPVFLFKVGAGGFWLLGLFAFYSIIYPLKRIEMGEDKFVATDYFKNFQYSYESVQTIEENDWLLFKAYTIVLKEKGSFGKEMTFIGSNKRWPRFRAAYPRLFASIYKGT